MHYIMLICLLSFTVHASGQNVSFTVLTWPRETANGTESTITTTTTPSPMAQHIRPLSRATQDEDRLNLPHTATGLQTHLQRMNDRLTTIEAIQNQQLRKLDTMDYRLTKMEILCQDKPTGVDKSSTQVIGKLEDLEWEINKFGTLIDVIRQDIDKVSQRQTELKVAINSGAIQTLSTYASSRGQTGGKGNRGKGTIGNDTLTDIVGFSELGTKVQSFAAGLQTVRRTMEQTQTLVQHISSNMTDVANLTRTLSRYTSDQLVTKQYLQEALRELFSEGKQLQINIQSCETHLEMQEHLAHDCSQLQNMTIGIKNGVYRLKPQRAKEPFFVYCDFENDGGGWTVIQKRFDGSVNFFRSWPEYKHGFGNAGAEHWLGNEKIHLLTTQEVYQLRIDLEDFENEKKYANYSAFALGSEADGFMIKLLGGYEGDAGDSFTYHAGVKFSTMEIDNDQWDGANCAEMHKGGWWYKGCEMANLNGQYLVGQIHEGMQHQGVYWYEFHGPEYSLQRTSMKIRPASYQPKPLP